VEDQNDPRRLEMEFENTIQMNATAFTPNKLDEVKQTLKNLGD
jgi:hypothetical protein